MKKIKTWLNDRIIDGMITAFVRWFQSRSPKTYAIIVAVAGTLHVYATTLLLELEELCNNEIVCFENVNSTIATVIYWISVIVLILAGTSLSKAKRQ